MCSTPVRCIFSYTARPWLWRKSTNTTSMKMSSHKKTFGQSNLTPTNIRFSTTCPPDITTCCSYDYNILSNIKYEQILPENMHEDSVDSQRGRGVGDRVVTGLKSVKCEVQRPALIEQQTILPIMDTHLVSMKSCNVKEEMKPEKKADPGEYSRTSSETRHWVVSSDGVLEEVKSEHTYGVSDILSVEDFGANVDNVQYWSGTNDAIMECESQLSVSERKYTGVKHYIGDTCGTSFSHQNAVKGRERPQLIVKHFTCDTCGKSFTRSSALREHDRIHTGVKPFTCDICGKQFNRSGGLKAHGRTHTGVKHFTCDACGKSFSRSNNLRVHEIMNSGVKPCCCNTCGRSLAETSTLRVHERIHSGVKPFTCDTCGKSFRHTGALREHERIHTGVKPFTCDTCGKSFIQSSGLKRHEKRHKQV